MSEALLSMRGVTKRFGAVQALRGIDLEVRAGEVHALVGENGAGKSTLMKVLSGAVSPDAGSMELEGRPYVPRGPRDALSRGVAMVYQELNLAPHLTVEQNLLLGREASRLGWLTAKDNRARVSAALTKIGHPELDPDRRVATLSVGEKQLVEIARAVLENARIVVLDEPTSSLSSREAETLYALIDRLARDGVAVVFISHFLEEVKRVAHRYTVLRDGASIETGELEEVSIERLIEAMVGRALDEVYPRVPHERGDVVLTLEGLAGQRAPRAASLTLHRGEILGIAGLVGAGRTELLRALFGLDRVADGRVTIAGTTDGGRDARARIGQGLGMLSEDRKDEGLSLSRSIVENLTLSRIPSKWGWLDAGGMAKVGARWIRELNVKAAGAEIPVANLSGGNQQKVALGRLLHQDADVLLLDEPTRGVDVGSKAEIYRLIGALAAKGKAILVVSSYLPELMGICDRIAVMHRGRLGAARPVGEWTEARILDEAARGAGEGAAA
ncbi:MAG: sugar ABC transporter ATP-binding protein [Sandaracinaceae bacterium]